MNTAVHPPLTVDDAVALLRRDELVAIPTETVYGLGADASSPTAVAKIFAAKGRPADHPLIVHLGALEQLDDWACDIPPFARLLATHFWPGPLTLVLRRSAKVADVVTGGQQTVGLRVPAHPLTLALLHRFGGGISAPSANRFGHISATTPAHVRAEFGALFPVLDGGQCEVGIESTIIDCSRGRPVVLRPGGISIARLSAVLGEIPGMPDAGAPRVSGALASHYAPRTALMLAPTATIGETATRAVRQGTRCGVLTFSPVGIDKDCTIVIAPTDARGYAQMLYHNLRELDELNLDLLLVASPPDTPEWLAVNDRLKRAAFQSD